MDELTPTPTQDEKRELPRFFGQWTPRPDNPGQAFVEPSKTIPDQSLTIPEIIARFTRSGMVPATVRRVDDGGQVAGDPDADPMDDWNDVQRAAAAARAAQSQDPAPQDPAPQDPPAE